MKRELRWLKDIIVSPFKFPKVIIHVGSIKVSTPYFLPRVWRPSKEKKGYLTATPRKFGLDIVGLGWKDKWNTPRFEWSPIWSFVIWKLQIAIIFRFSDPEVESFLYYNYYTDKSLSTLGRLKQCEKEFPNKWISSIDGERDYFKRSLKSKWIKKLYK